MLKVVADLHAERQRMARERQDSELLRSRAIATLSYIYRALADAAFALRVEGIEVDITLAVGSEGRYWFAELRAQEKKVRAEWPCGEQSIRLSASHSDARFDPIAVPDNGHVVPEATRVAQALCETL